MAANEASLALLTRLGFAHRRDIEEGDGTTTRCLAVVRGEGRRSAPSMGG
ncbi:GCN5-related N-acetyltransferase [Streptomyces iranensis]|uniref:GCN5-related N-acetyltransferase n=1 Tax=Streptomyces iranensis TaxID=576784 RepID=A0A060ZW22_9ACTN|nr:RimJ/RimL family protein N-acetyltransferase [Streptomyces iranensis]CDR10310.1 GCN5-related N-acetyltransferase [Streptomyces iranensis]